MTWKRKQLREGNQKAAWVLQKFLRAKFLGAVLLAVGKGLPKISKTANSFSALTYLENAKVF